MARVNGITQFLLATHTIILTLLRKHSPDGTTRTRRHTSDIAYYSIYRPPKDERLSWPSWLTYSGRLTHMSGHPSAAGRAWDKKVRRSKTNVLTTVPRSQPSAVKLVRLTTVASLSHWTSTSVYNTTGLMHAARRAGSSAQRNQKKTNLTLIKPNVNLVKSFLKLVLLSEKSFIQMTINGIWRLDRRLHSFSL